MNLPESIVVLTGMTDGIDLAPPAYSFLAAASRERRA